MRSATNLSLTRANLFSQNVHFLHGFGEKHLKNLTKWNGLCPRVCSNTNKRPKHAQSFSSTEYVVRFLFSFAEKHALLLSGRIPVYSRDYLHLLPLSTSSGLSGRCATNELKLRAPFILCHTPPFATYGEHWCQQCHQNSAAIVCMADDVDESQSIVREHCLSSFI